MSQYLNLSEIIGLSRASKKSNSIMKSITDICYDSPNVSLEIINCILRFFYGLKRFQMNCCDCDHTSILSVLYTRSISLIRFDNTNLDSPFYYCPREEFEHIISFEINNCNAASIIYYASIIKNAKNLKRLSFSSILSLRSEHLNFTISLLPSLQELDLSRLASLTFITFNQLHRDTLKVLRITNCSLLRTINTYSDQNLVTSTWRSLLSCDFSNTSIDSNTITKFVASCPVLKTISLTQIITFTGAMKFCSQSLEIIDLQLCNNIERLFVECMRLKELKLHGCFSLNQLSVKSQQIKELDLAMLTNLTSLLIICPEMKKIILNGCKILDDDSIQNLRNLDHNIHIEGLNCYNLQSKIDENDILCDRFKSIELLEGGLNLNHYIRKKEGNQNKLKMHHTRSSSI